MSELAIKIENVAKQYRLGQVGTGTLSHDLNRWWHRVRGKEDPYLKVGEQNDRAKAGNSPYVWALHDISFDVKKGEVLGIIGKNGAGKSTLLKILSKITSPTKGSIRAKGRIASLLEVGTGFHPELTGRENLYLNGTILGMTKAEVSKKLEEIVEFAGVARYLDTPVKRYSSGMMVRLGFAVAAHLEPEILIVDEVLAVGDAEFQKKAVGKMQEVSRGGGRTVLFVSHNMQSIQNLCTRALLLEDGRLVMDGGVDATIQHYLKEREPASKIIPVNYPRRGEGTFKFKSWELLNEDNTPTDMFLSGDFFKLRLHYHLKRSLPNIVIEATFYNSNLSYLTGFRSDSKGMKLFLEPGEGYVDLVLERFPFSGGLYLFNLSAYYKETIQDYIKRVGQVQVENGNFFGTGIIPARSKEGLFLTNFKFESSNNNVSANGNSV